MMTSRPNVAPRPSTFMMIALIGIKTERNAHMRMTIVAKMTVTTAYGMLS